MAKPFQTIGIFGRVKSPAIIETLEALINTLRKMNRRFVVEEETAESLLDTSITLINREKLHESCDLLIVVGGDGSLLHATHAMANHPIPVLGINRGRLGFLTDILPTELNKIQQILDGQYHIEKRFLLKATVILQDEIIGQGYALNELALIPSSVPHMSEFEIFINDGFVCSQNSDGVIIATPTGSTAYALSGGGPILHPELDAIVIVPMFPHTLSIRPIVIEANQRIRINITPNNTATPRVTCDSQNIFDAPPGSHITIEKKQERLHLIHPLDYDYYKTLRSKLHWGRKLHYAE